MLRIKRKYDKFLQENYGIWTLEDNILKKKMISALAGLMLIGMFASCGADPAVTQFKEEDVSDCFEQEVAESPVGASIEVDVYNEDGFGKYFVKKLMQRIPEILAKQKKILPNGDIAVKISGDVDALKKAFAFYLGQHDYNALPKDDKEEFDSLVRFDDGDSLAEADYREKVAHCLDPIGVDASAANLAGQDTCAISIIKEEKAKRKAKKILKCLRENDLPSLTDDELDLIDKIQDVVIDGDDADLEKLTDDELRVWNIVLDQMGYTQEEWDKMTPEQQEKAFKDNPANKVATSRSGFGPSSKTINVYDPESDMMITTGFNPNYDKEAKQDLKKAAKEKNAADAIADRVKMQKDAFKAARGSDTWKISDWAKMLAPLDNHQRKKLMKELLADVQKDNADNPYKSADEEMFIKKMFGRPITLRDLGKAWGMTFPGAKIDADNFEGAWMTAIRDVGEIGMNGFKNICADDAKFAKFIEALKKRLDEYRGSRRSRPGRRLEKPAAGL